MTYSSILTVLTDGPDPLRALDAAVALATDYDAHLDVLTVGVDRSVQGFAYTEMSATMLELGVKEAKKEAARLEKAAQSKLALTGLRSAVTPVVCSSGMLPGAIRRHARFADIVVLPSPYGDATSGEEPVIVEAALFDAHVPVLILPQGYTDWATPRKVAIGWNESDEALRAVRSARPLLAAADNAYITVIDPPQHGPDRSDPGGLLAQYLARHGVRCEIDVLARSLPRISDIILRQCTDRNVDMLVMGAYGRARWSEAMFGGATRDMLEKSPVPLFLAR